MNLLDLMFGKGKRSSKKLTLDEKINLREPFNGNVTPQMLRAKTISEWYEAFFNHLHKPNPILEDLPMMPFSGQEPKMEHTLPETSWVRVHQGVPFPKKNRKGNRK